MGMWTFCSRFTVFIHVTVGYLVPPVKNLRILLAPHAVADGSWCTQIREVARDLVNGVNCTVSMSVIFQMLISNINQSVASSDEV